jgi:hypothetical protein
VIPFLGDEMAKARIERLLEEAEGESRARDARPGAGPRPAQALRAAVGRRLIGVGFRLANSAVPGGR